MRTTPPAALLALAAAAAPADAQELITYTLSFVEVIAGTPSPGTPVSNPNGTLDPGEAARIQLTVTISPGIGSTATYTPPPGPGFGTIAGLRSIYFDVIGSGSNGGAGTWTGLSRAVGWSLGSAGVPSALGDRVTSCGAGQFPLGDEINSMNPIPNIWRGIWTPLSYDGDYTFSVFRAAASTPGRHSAIIVVYGLDPNGSPEYVDKFVDAQFSSIRVLAVPSPAAHALLAIAAPPLLRRRRR